MDELKEKTTDLADHIQDIADTFYKLTVVNVTQKLSNISASLIVSLLFGVLGVFVVFFLGLALSWWLGDLVQSRAGGFLLGAGFFLILLLVIGSMGKKWIFPFIRNFIIRKVYDQND